MNGGERQLICVICALLFHSIIISIDKTAAYMNVQTVCFIHEMIGAQFTNCTIITIFHTLHTIIDMKDGRFRECDKPLTLIKNPDGVFLEVMMGVRLKLEKED